MAKGIAVGASLAELIGADKISVGCKVVLRTRDRQHHGVVTEDGGIRMGRKEYASPSRAAAEILGRPANGWVALRFADGDLAGKPLQAVRVPSVSSRAAKPKAKDGNQARRSRARSR